MSHEVSVLCDCDDIEQCRTERYISDIRIAIAQIRDLEAQLALLDASASQSPR